MSELSSPVAHRSSLPPSSAPLPTQSVDGQTTPRRQTNALALDDDAEAQVEDEQNASTTRKRRRPRTQQPGDVPLVQDTVGERVTETFETFLKTCALS